MENFVVEFTNLSRTDGSALLSIGETIVQAAVYGPVDVSLSKELYDKALLEVTFRPQLGHSTCAERLIECYIKRAVEAAVMSDLHPRTSISIILQEIQNDGNLLACCVNAAVLALLDAGISMKHVVATVTSGIQKNGHIIAFPTEKEQEDCTSVMIWSFEGSKKQIVNFTGKSAFSEADFNKSLNACRQSSENVLNFFRKSVEKRYTKAEDVETN